MNRKILFFSPHTSIWVHSLPEAQIARYASKDFSIDMIYCDHDFSEYCVAMSANSMKQTDEKNKKLELCSDCLRKQSIVKEINPTMHYYSIKNFVEEEHRIECKNLSESISISDLLNYKIDGIELGILSQYEVLLQYKKNNFDYSLEEQNSARINFYNTLISFRAATNYFKSNRVEYMVVYNYLYSVNHIWKKVAEKNGAEVYSMHAGENLAERINTLQISKNQNVRVELKKIYNELAETPIFKEKYISSISRHFQELFSGEHFYAYSSTSSGKNIFSFFGLNPKRKTVLAAMSSYDERFSSEAIGFFNKIPNMLFDTQKKWAEDLIYFFSKKKDYQLILRVHPREFPNKRDSLRSTHSIELEELFQNLPENVKINYPTDNLSIYEVGMNMDCIIGAWSSVGEELALYGIPVLIYNDILIAYPANLNYIETTKEKYFEKMEEILKDDSVRYDKIKNSMRWYALKFETPFKVLKNFHRYEKKTFPTNSRMNILKKLFIEYRISKLKKKLVITKEEEFDLMDFFSFDSDRKLISKLFKENLFFSIQTKEIEKSTESEESLAIKKALDSILGSLLKTDPNLENSKQIKKLKNYFNLQSIQN